MNCRCKGSCKMNDFKQKYDTRTGNPSAYRLGYGRCSECEYYIKATKCPCCGDHLRTKTRSNTARRLFNKAMT